MGDAIGKQSDTEPTVPSISKIQWHPGFRQREFRKYRDYLRFEEELPLTVNTLFVDLVVIKIIHPVPIENELGKIFRKYNICEYKGPDDGLTIDDFYKTLGYACIFKCSGNTVDEIPASEITMSLIRDSYPRNLMQALQAEGIIIKEQYPGVYYLKYNSEEKRVLHFPTQIIVTSQLERTTHSGLRVLRRPADSEDIIRFLTEARQETEPGDIANVNKILSASLAANKGLYAQIGRESDMLYPALRELMSKDLDERWEEGREEGREEGIILGTVDVYRDEMGLDNKAITDRIIKRFKLSTEQAAQYVFASKAMG